MTSAKINSKQIARQPAIDLRNIWVTRGEQNILQDITWAVPDGSCAAVLGPNGSGKSTLVRTLLGHIWPTRGEVRVLGKLFGETDLNVIRESIRLVQSTSAIELDQDQNTLNIVLTGFFGSVGLFQTHTASMKRQAEKFIRQLGLQRQMQHRFSTLSSGERMRCLIARSLVVEPQLLILDEPTAGLDLLAREQVLATLENLAQRLKSPPTILLITHHVEELLPQTTHVLLLKEGQSVASGTPNEVLTSPILSRVYGCPVEVTTRDKRYWLQVPKSAWKKVARTFQ